MNLVLEGLRVGCGIEIEKNWAENGDLGNSAGKRR